LAAWVKAMVKHILAAICLLAATPAVAQNSSAIPPPASRGSTALTPHPKKWKRALG
jgi:hypothetical protein